MKIRALIFFFIFVVLHAYSANKAKAETPLFENQNFTSANISDSLALVALFSDCNGPNWTKKNNWLTGQLDTWQGVTVENGRVVIIDLGYHGSSVGLTGQLPTELSNLSELRSISLEINKLTGNLPESWSKLKKLEYIRLNGNEFTGPLPESWSTLVKLQELNLYDNQLTGTLPNSWSLMEQLQVILINNNQLTGTLPESWSVLSNLIFVACSRNQLTGNLPDSWSALVNMKYLSFEHNQFAGRIPTSWLAFVNLVNFSIGNNQLTGLPALTTLTKLNEFYIENNRLDFETIEPNVGIPDYAFGYSPQSPVGQKQTLTKSPGDEFKISVNVGGKNNKYQWFKDGTLISGATGTEYVIPSVTISDAANYTCNITNTVATQLTLASNPITLQVINDIYNLNTDSLALVELYNQCNGQYWTKKDNWLTGRLNTWQGVTVDNGRVVELDLGDPAVFVGLTGSIPSELSTLSEIRKINFGNNELTGNLPKNWSNLSNLKLIILSENKFSGELPIEWSSLNNLVYLNLENNQLSGTLPIEWASLVNLIYLHLSYNKLSGTLPESWSSLNNLFHLGIGTNQITGSLPDSWSSLSNLHELILSNNKLSGTLPESWSSLSSLTHLILFNNQFTGALPDNWSNLVNLIELFLSINQLSGSLPESWSKLVNLNQLHLSNNFLTGTFPDSWSTLINLYSLNLARNKFSGSFPKSWKNFVNMQDLMLHGNLLSELPELSNLSKLYTLYIDNNFLDFGDIEPIINIPKILFTYSPQEQIGKTETIIKNIGAEFKISVEVGGTSNIYQWFKDTKIIVGANSAVYTIPSVTLSNAGVYECQITNTVATQLTLTNYPITLHVQNQAFSANAGIDQTVNEGTDVLLDGSLSYDPAGNPLTYKWTVPAGITLSSESGPKPTFIAPEIDADTTYTFSLVVNNGTLDSPADQVLITVLNINKAPIANAGMDQSVMTGEMVSLDGSASFDPDGKKLTYKWSAPEGIILSFVSDSIPTFTAPETKSDTIYTFSLIVNDGLIDSPADQVMITVFHADKQLLVNAGPDQYVYERTTVHLDGSASTFLNKKPLTYQWICPSDIYLSSLTDEKPTFKAPEVATTTKYTFSLVVNDGIISSILDQVNVFIVDEIRIYPNITTGIVNIEFNIAANRETEVLLLNLLGTVLIRNKITNPSLFQLDLSKFADETYVIIVNYDDKHYSSKVILRK